MSVDFNQIKKELGAIRNRARDLEGALRDLERVDAARQIVAATDRVGRLVEDVERELKKAKRDASDV